MDEVNSFGLTKKEVLKVYNENITQNALDLINKHIHWYNKKGYCNICSDKKRKDVEND